jgi:hypothetical protein
MSSIQKVACGELLTKQAMRKSVLYMKNTYMLNLLLNVVTTGIEAHVILENKFLCASVKKVCSL